MENKTIRLFEAFAGIGSQYKALKNISKIKKWNIEHAGMVEWYVDAIIGYINIHCSTFKPSLQNLFVTSNISLNSKDYINKNSRLYKNKTLKNSYLNYAKATLNNLFDINEVNWKNFPKFIDIFTYSFPCQDLSAQGLQKGINKEAKTRSGLLWEVERIFDEINLKFKQDEKPKYLLMENVKNLVSKKHVNNYNKWLNKLNELGYVSKTYLLNSKDFNSCQSRVRAYCISVREDVYKKTNFKFPNFTNSNNKIPLASILENSLDNHKYLDLKKYKTTNFKKAKSGVISKKIIEYSNFNSENFIYSENGIGPTLTASGANSRIKIETNKKIRYMHAKEAIKYMGFCQKDYLNLKKKNLLTDNKIIFLAGNSISVQVLEKIFSSFVF